MNDHLPPKDWLVPRIALFEPTTPEFHAWSAEVTIARELNESPNRARYMMILTTIKMALQPPLVRQRKDLSGESDKLIEQLKDVQASAREEIERPNNKLEALKKFRDEAEETLNEIAGHYFTEQDAARCREMAKRTLSELPET